LPVLRQPPVEVKSTAPAVAIAPNLTEKVVAALRTRIESGEFAADAKLPSEGQLVRGYGVSRTVVREAISQLRARGLVATRRGIGTFARHGIESAVAFPASRVDPAMLDEVVALLELRISVETETAALAAARRSDAQLARMATLVEAIDRAGESGGDDADADFEFHVTVAEAAHNHYFADLLRHLGRAIIPRTRVDSPAAARQERAEYVRTVNREHQEVYRAIARRDPDAARAAMRTHLANSRERLSALRET
jgi:DNA-binding FadR family transcriptional regulator